MAARAGALHRGLQGGRVDVADVHQFSALGMLLQRAEMIVGDAAAAHQRKADLAIGNRRVTII